MNEWQAIPYGPSNTSADRPAEKQKARTFK